MSSLLVSNIWSSFSRALKSGEEVRHGRVIVIYWHHLSISASDVLEGAMLKLSAPSASIIMALFLFVQATGAMLVETKQTVLVLRVEVVLEVLARRALVNRS